jgi:superoxide reductase
MTQVGQVYRCNICGNIVQVKKAGAGQLICCGQPMEFLKPKDLKEKLKKSEK